MSSASSPPPTRGNTTRQQLDELDALLQRMLSLPIDAPTGDAPPPPPPGGTLPPDGAPAATSLPPPPPARPPAPPPPPTFSPSRVPTPADPARTWTIDLPAAPNPQPARGDSWAGNSAGLEAFHVRTAAPVPADDRLARGGPQSARPSEALPADATPPRVVVAPPAQPAAPAPRPIPAPATNRVPFWAWPLVGLNALLALPFGLLGPVGRLLTGPAGRNFLGAVGLLTLAAAAAIVALDWYGWNW
jgi:hypothetical protein